MLPFNNGILLRCGYARQLMQDTLSLKKSFRKKFVPLLVLIHLIWVSNCVSTIEANCGSKNCVLDLCLSK